MSTPRPDESDAPPPRSVTEILCREVGAAHPDGALKQIRTMKRLLRDHYRVQQRLERYGVEDLSDAVSRIATLSRQLEAYRAQERRQAERRISAIESLIARVDALWSSPAAPAGASSSEDARPAPAPSDEDGTSSLLSGILELVGALRTELDELRLELWAHEADDDVPPSNAGETAADLLARVEDALQDAEDTVDRLRSTNEALQTRNDRLEAKVERLTDTVETQRRRLQRVDRGPAAASQTDP